MNDHHHHYGEYAEARHDHRGDYADERHDHDLDYAEKHHRHYDLEREDERLKALLDQWQADLRELRENLRDALERILALEDRQPDCVGPMADEPAAEDRSLPGDLAEAARGGEPPFASVPRLPRLRKLAPDDAETGEETSGE